MCPKSTQRGFVLVLSVVFSFYSLTLALQNCQPTRCMLLTTADVAKKLRLHCLSGKILLSEIEVATVLVLCRRHSVLRLSVCVCLTHTHPFNGHFSGTTRVGRYQKGKTNLDFTEARDSEWQWRQLEHMQVCTSLQTDSHASTSPLSFFSGRMPFLPLNQQRQSTEGMCVSKCIQSNLLKWIVLGPDHEYPLIHILYFTLCPNRTRQIISI